MVFKYVLSIFFFSFLLSCNLLSQEKDLIDGIRIEHGPNLGTTHTDTLGNKYYYVSITSTIYNDNTIPVALQSALSGKYSFPDFCGNDIEYKVFILPASMTPDTATIYNGITTGEDEFLKTVLDNPRNINITIDPGKYTVITIATLLPQPNNCDAVPRNVFSSLNKLKYENCDKQLNVGVASNPLSNIWLRLEYYYNRKWAQPEDGCVTIPFAIISNSN